MTSDDLLRPRLDPRAIVRDTWEIVRLHWRPLILIAALTDALLLGVGWSHRWALHAIDRAEWPRLPLLATILSTCLQTWISGFGWMTTAVAVADVTRRLPVDARAALRQSLASSWRWSGLIVLLILIWLVPVAVRFLVPLAFRSIWKPEFFVPSPWLLKWSPYGLITEIVTWLGIAALAYIAFAPLALVLDSAGAGSALAVSWRRVRGNWLRVCGGAILLWIPYGVLKVASRYLPNSPPARWTTVVLKDIAWAFLLVGAALMYVRLIQFGSGPPPASDLVEPPFLNPEAVPS